MSSFAVKTGSVLSADGTVIGYHVLGSGPALVAVHGLGAFGSGYEPFAHPLVDTYTIYLMDRRGRDLSGPQGEDYSLQKEYEDVIALLQASNASLLFGHSYGAIVALGVAQRFPLQKLMVYDPPLLIDEERLHAFLPAYKRAIASKHYAKAQRLLAKFTGMQTLLYTLIIYLLMPRLSQWPRIVEALEASVKEWELDKAIPAPADYASITTDTLLLMGEKSAPFFRNSIEVLANVLPHAQLVTMKGKGHAALGPAAAKVKQFLGHQER